MDEKEMNKYFLNFFFLKLFSPLVHGLHCKLGRERDSGKKEESFLFFLLSLLLFPCFLCPQESRGDEGELRRGVDPIHPFLCGTLRQFKLTSKQHEKQ